MIVNSFILKNRQIIGQFSLNIIMLSLCFSTFDYFIHIANKNTFSVYKFAVILMFR